MDSIIESLFTLLVSPSLTRTLPREDAPLDSVLSIHTQPEYESTVFLLHRCYLHDRG